MRTRFFYFIFFIFIFFVAIIPFTGAYANSSTPAGELPKDNRPTPPSTTTPTPTQGLNSLYASLAPDALLDDFNRPNGALGSNWAGSTTDYAIVGQLLDVNGNTTTPIDIFWNPTTFDVNQEVSVKLSTIDIHATEIGLVLKAQTNATDANLIEVAYHPSGQYVQVWTKNGTGWTLHGGNILVSFANGDTFSARANVYGQVEVYKNGAFVATRDVSSWPYAANTGYIGLFHLNASATVLDDFGGGNISAPPTPTPTPAPCYDPESCSPVTAYSAQWECDLPTPGACNGINPWHGAVISWPSWSAYPNNARAADQSRTVYSYNGHNMLYPYMGPWANGCQVYVNYGTVVIIEWERGTNTWVETQLEAGQSHTITLVPPQNNAMIEGPNEVTTEFRVTLSNCTPQDIYATPTPTPTFTPTPLPTAVITMGETNVLGSTQSISKNVLSAQRATLSQAARVKSVSIYISTVSGQIRLGVYNDATGVPGTLQGFTGAFTPVVGWNTVNVSPQPLLTTGDYWLAFVTDTDGMVIPIQNTETSHFFSYVFGPLPPSFPTSRASGTFHYSYYATLIVNAPTAIELKGLEGHVSPSSQIILKMTVTFLFLTGILFWIDHRNKQARP
ncbi:MAG TPA: hypothetical protein PK530_01480 [Anaerolineales bacterium]|nr:hypothetical protein [Anaerolineales bacterium]